jgi:hypothetical protein
MNPMILCPTCRRHLFAGEAKCPFCGVALTAEVRGSSPPPLSSDLSRAQRYAIGTALAVSVAGAGCGPGPTIVRAPATSVEQSATPIVDTDTPDPETTNPDETDPFATASDSKKTTVATDPDPDDSRKKVVPPHDPIDTQQDGWRNRRRSQCVQSPKGIVCPPYGCVFPDEACDIVRA